MIIIVIIKLSVNDVFYLVCQTIWRIVLSKGVLFDYLTTFGMISYNAPHCQDNFFSFSKLDPPFLKFKDFILFYKG